MKKEQFKFITTNLGANIDSFGLENLWIYDPETEKVGQFTGNFMLYSAEIPEESSEVKWETENGPIVEWLLDSKELILLIIDLVNVSLPLIEVLFGWVKTWWNNRNLSKDERRALKAVNNAIKNK